MYNVVIAQHYFEKIKNEEGKEEFKGFIGMSQFFSDYTKKLYDCLNKFMLNTKMDKNLDEKKSFLVNEIYLNLLSTKEELNEPNETLSIADLLENDDLLQNLERVECKLFSELNPQDAVPETSKVLLMFQLSVQKDFATLLNDGKNLNISFDSFKGGK